MCARFDSTTNKLIICSYEKSKRLTPYLASNNNNHTTTAYRQFCSSSILRRALELSFWDVSLCLSTSLTLISDRRWRPPNQNHIVHCVFPQIILIKQINKNLFGLSSWNRFIFFFYAFRWYFSFNFFALFYLHTTKRHIWMRCWMDKRQNKWKRVTKGRNKKNICGTRKATSWASRKGFLVYLRCSCVTFVYTKKSTLYFFSSSLNTYIYILLIHLSCVCKLVSVISSLF